MGRPAGWMTELTGQGADEVAGQAVAAGADVEWLVWHEITEGLNSEEQPRLRSAPRKRLAADGFESVAAWPRS